MSARQLIAAAGVVAAGLLTLVFLGRGVSSHAQPRLVVLYATCTVNKNFLSPYNPRVHYTPYLARFARQSVVFDHHFTEAGQSGVAFASIFSGNQADRHGIFFHPTALSDRVHLIAEAFADNGYETFFWADHPMASPELNYAQGVEPRNIHWKKLNPIPGRGRASFLRAGDPELAKILNHLKTDPDYKAFVMTNFTVTHGPYSSKYVRDFCNAYPDECTDIGAAEFERFRKLIAKNALGLTLALDVKEQELGLSEEDMHDLILTEKRLYESTVYHLDQLFGGLVDEIDRSGLSEETLIAFTADHGEVLYRENALFKWSHGFMAAPEVVSVPFLLRQSGIKPQRYEGVSRSIDVFPTLAGLADVSLPSPPPQGVDLSPALRGEEPPPRLVAFGHTALPPESWIKAGFLFPSVGNLFPRQDPNLISVWANDGTTAYLLQRTAGGETFEPAVYDWAHDPAQTKNLYDPNNPDHQEMVRRLAAYKTNLVEAYARWQALAEGHLPSERQEEILRSLGYIK